MEIFEIFLYLIPILSVLKLNDAQKNGDISRKCSKTLVCGVGSCCRGTDNKVIPAALQQFTDVDWWRAQIGINPGNCTNSLATEGEQCDSFCLCASGFLCTPNILCKNCGNICMASDFVSKLVRYYDVGCNCANYLINYGPPHQNRYPPPYPINPLHNNFNTFPNNAQGFDFNGINGIGISNPYGIAPGMKKDDEFNQDKTNRNNNGNTMSGGNDYVFNFENSKMPVMEATEQSYQNIKIVDNIVQIPGFS